MPVLKCPGCHKSLSIPARYAGKQCDCPNCGREIHVPVALVAPIAQPIADSADHSGSPPGLDTSSQRPAAADAASPPPATESSLKPAPPQVEIPQVESVEAGRTRPVPQMILALFDFKFEHYLTPWIIRFTWGCALLLAGLWILFLGYQFVASTFASSQPSIPSMTNSPDAMNQMLDQLISSANQKSPLSFFSSFAGRLIMLLTTLIGILLTVLWTRVMLETLIVIFNISTTLKSIEEKVS